MASTSLRRAGRRILDLLYPPSYALCSAPGAFLCARCSDSLPKADGPRCRRCWMPASGSCANCAELLPAFSSLRSSLRYEGDARKLVQALKSRDRASLAEDLGRLLSLDYPKLNTAYDALAPVPLTGLKKRQRGYNQASLLAREVAKTSGVPVLDSLERRGGRQAQSQAGHVQQRRQNVANAFALKRGVSVARLRLLLVDDVATSGATLDACAQGLLDAGASCVDALTLARED